MEGEQNLRARARFGKHDPLASRVLRVSRGMTTRLMGSCLFLKGLGHAILGNFSIDQVVIELIEITK